MNKVYLKLNKTIVEDIILTSEDVDKGILYRITSRTLSYLI